MAVLPTSSDIQIASLLPEHRQSVINLLTSSFFIDEPLNAKLQFDIPHEILAWVDYLLDISLRDQCSFVAIDNNSLHKNVIGVILNGVSNRAHDEELPSIKSEKLKFLLELLDEVIVGYDLYDFYQTDRLFHCDIINVEESQRGQNVSKRLIAASEDKARQLDIKGAYAICTGVFSKRAFERQGFRVINELLYSKYGKERLTDMAEHDRCSLMVKNI